MKKILYIGNKLDNSRSNVSSVSVLGALFEKEGYKLFYASTKENKFARLFDMIKTCIKYRRRVDFVIIDTYSTLNFYFALIISQLCRLLKLKYIPKLNGGNLSYRLKHYPLFSKLIFNSAKVSVSPSLYLKQEFNNYGFKNVKYIPNALEIDKYNFCIRKLDVIKLLWVRSFSKIYNPLLAINVLQRLQSKDYDVELCMVGPDSDGSLTEAKSYCDQHGIDVKFTYKLSKSDWALLSKDYNVFINTTNFDNMPVSVVEAMALGLPIVSTNVGGMPFLIEEGVDGLLVPPKDEKVMCDAIIRLHEDENLSSSLALNARQKAETYDWEVVKQHWFDLLG